MVPLTDGMGLVPAVSIKGTIAIDTMLNFDSDLHGHIDVMCKQNFTIRKFGDVFCLNQFYLQLIW